MSAPGWIGQCGCHGDINIFATFNHTFYRHRPLLQNLSTWTSVLDMPPLQAESCQDGYKKYVWVTTFGSPISGSITRTYEHNNYVSDPDTNTVTEAGGTWDPDEWEFDGDYTGDEPDITTDTSTHFVCTNHFQKISDPTIKLVITTDFELSTSSTHAAFRTRCEDLYDEVTFAEMEGSIPESYDRTVGYLSNVYAYNSSGTVVGTVNEAASIYWDAQFCIDQTVFVGVKSIRYADTPIYPQGGMVFDTKIINPSGATYLREWADTFACNTNGYYSNYVSDLETRGLTETCTDLTEATSYEVSATPYGFAVLADGSCPS